MLGSSGPIQLSRSSCFGSIFPGDINITVNVSSKLASSETDDVGALSEGINLEQFFKF